MKQKILLIFATIVSQIAHAPIDQRLHGKHRPLTFENLKKGEMRFILSNRSLLKQSFFIGTFYGIKRIDVEPGESHHHVLTTALKRGQEKRLRFSLQFHGFEGRLSRMRPSFFLLAKYGRNGTCGFYFDSKRVQTSA